jgi:hypothetical protein
VDTPGGQPSRGLMALYGSAPFFHVVFALGSADLAIVSS